MEEVNVPPPQPEVPAKPVRKWWLIPALCGGSILILGGIAIGVKVIMVKAPAQMSPIVALNPQISPTIIAPTQAPSVDEFGLLNADFSHDVNLKYFPLGKISTGKYSGYDHWIVYAEQGIGPGGPQASEIASLDYQHFVMTNFDSWSYFVNKDKVGPVDVLTEDLPQQIPLGNDFALYRKEIYLNYIDSGKKDHNNNAIFVNVLQSDFFSYTALNSPVSNLKMYQYQMYQFGNPAMVTPLPEDKYFKGQTDVIVVNAQGIAYVYALTNKQAQTSLKFSQNEISTNQPIYKEYADAFPIGCGVSHGATILQNISEADLSKIGSVGSWELFSLTNKNHPLYQAQYQRKFWDGATDHPELAAYIAKNPLLILKDYWGRWVAVGEYDYQLMGGCGKPVIYLYPTQDTQVSVKFAAPMQLDKNMPIYHDGWQVLAHPNGQLTDLQPQFTSCDAIDTSHFGLEYALEACKTNNYPYLYWSGQSLTRSYPQVDQGWIVVANQLNEFMRTKLTEVGLSEQERADMLEFWLPTMQAKRAPYYRISFLQTAQMNYLAPMHVTPRPDTVFRIFLDWQPFASKPPVPLVPQNLDKLTRQGFTLVEWGGLIQ